MQKSKMENILMRIEMLVTGVFLLEEGIIDIMDTMTEILEKTEPCSNPNTDICKGNHSISDLDKIF